MLLTILLLFLGLLVLLPITVLALECGAASFAKVKPLTFRPLTLGNLTDETSHFSPVVSRADRGTPGSVQTVVLVPAHNEARVIAQTLQSIQPQLAPQDRLVVVADNCTDETAAIATHMGATVIERFNPQQRGKGYALDYGIHYLAQSPPPDVVILMDADCYVHPGCIEQLVALSQNSDRPVQSCYVMDVPPNPSIKDRISAFAFLVKNWIRPLGLKQLGAPCLLTGTGMAFPWHIIKDAPLASSNIVEDMQLGLDLAIAGLAPRFCATARVTGLLPQEKTTATQQRTRWEHGHLQTFVSQAPRLFAAAITQHRWDLLALVAELSIPPISFLVLVYLGYGAITLGAAIAFQVYLPVILAVLAGGLLGTAILLAWVKAARELLPFSTLLMTPLYLLWKIPLYLKFFIKPQSDWNKTRRE